MHGTRPPRPPARAINIRLARDANDLMTVTAIRSAVYLAEQDCPIEEEFDGNDLCAAHFLGYIGSEPAGCLRDTGVMPALPIFALHSSLGGPTTCTFSGSRSPS